MRVVTLLVSLMLLVAACSASAPENPPPTTPATAPDESTPESAPIATATSVESVTSATPVTVTASAETTETVAAASQQFIWNCYSCSGGQAWGFENGQAARIDLPVGIGNFFGYAPATHRILYSTPFAATGGGPSQMAIHDLWVLDAGSGLSRALIRDPVVVEAIWAPDGEHIAYILATDTSYELHWLGPDDEDKLLASDVAFTFDVSPDGGKVAFTRENNYQLPGEPGLYIVDVASGDESKISNADRAGAGSIDDRPTWSPAGDYLLLPTYGSPGGNGLVRAMVDGSSSVGLTFDPALEDEAWYQAEPFYPFAVSEDQFIGSASVNGNAQMGGDATLVLYQLNDARDTIIKGAEIGMGTLVGWDVPGSSVWLQTTNGMESVALPAL